ncbi:MAG: type II secretion system F family protein [Candidatus Eisenbacteria bacterium]|nr:type II secretion system F family protein [Candidatus Eisenbacteria bacterium]
MPTTFVWKGKTFSGQQAKGELTFETKAELTGYLRRKKIVATSVTEKKGERRWRLRRRKGVTTKDLAVFTRQLATMINSGLPISQCLDILSKQSDKGPFREMTRQVLHDVEAGSSLAEAMGKHKTFFDDLYINLVEVGEASGALDQMFTRLSGYLEKSAALKRKVKSAMTYPVMVTAVALGASCFMLVFIVPTFSRIFIEFGGQLPLPTRIVIGLSNFLQKFWWALGVFVFLLAVGFKQAKKSKGAREFIDRLKLKVPVFGDVLRKASVARFTRTLGTLVTSGVPILKGLEITAKVAGNKVIENAVLATRASVKEGETISSPLAESGAFPPMVVKMINVGEETGALDAMLNKVADFYEDEVWAAVEGLTAVIEPAMIVVMGLLVGGMLVSMYLPMFKLVTVISG